MTIPAASPTDPILYHERKVWVKGVEASVPIDPRLELLFGSGFITTSGTPGTVTDTTAIAAPGVGVRIRVWHLGIAPSYNVTGYGYTLHKRAASLNYVGVLAFGPGQGGEWSIAGGFPLSANEAVVLRSAASVANQGIFWTVLYTIEPG